MSLVQRSTKPVCTFPLACTGPEAPALRALHIVTLEISHIRNPNLPEFIVPNLKMMTPHGATDFANKKNPLLSEWKVAYLMVS